MGEPVRQLVAEGDLDFDPRRADEAQLMGSSLPMPPGAGVVNAVGGLQCAYRSAA